MTTEQGQQEPTDAVNAPRPSRFASFLGYRLRRILAVTLIASGAISASSQTTALLDRGWWVIVGVMPGTDFDTAAADRLHARVRQCGFEAFNDFSNKFTGFAEGFTVFVLGAYPTKKEAETILRKARKCVPDAYIKQGRYLGE
jgi:hypothetical protein